MSGLNTFPVSMQVKDRLIVVVGGDDEALNKVRLLAKTTARIRVIAREVSVDFSEWSVTVNERAFVCDDLDGAAMVFVADHGPDGDAAKIAARAAGIPLNVVDVPHECDFFTPSIIDRAPVSIAIMTEGQAPVLGRLIRSKIEAMLAPNTGAVARLTGTLRDRIASLVPDGVQRRRFYEKLVTSAQVSKALDTSDDAGRDVALTLLDEHAAENDTAQPGVVWLIGAGPGSEDLLTLRAQRLLQQADVIVHDQLVPELVVQMGRRDAERMPVGKAKGHHSISQSQINALIVRLAKQGKKVARLKSGDPMIFGRAGEEIAAMRKAGVDYQVVPGITAALAAAADTETPVTLRKVSSGFLAATAHGASGTELHHWAAVAQAGVTLGLYMGKSIASDVSNKLIAHGIKASTPVGVVVNAGRATKQTYTGTLSALAHGELNFADGPAVILIGDAIAHGKWDAGEQLKDWDTTAQLVEQKIMVA